MVDDISGIAIAGWGMWTLTKDRNRKLQQYSSVDAEQRCVAMHIFLFLKWDQSMDCDDPLDELSSKWRIVISEASHQLLLLLHGFFHDVVKIEE